MGSVRDERGMDGSRAFVAVAVAAAVAASSQVICRLLRPRKVLPQVSFNGAAGCKTRPVRGCVAVLGARCQVPGGREVRLGGNGVQFGGLEASGLWDWIDGDGRTAGRRIFFWQRTEGERELGPRLGRLGLSVGKLGGKLAAGRAG